MSAQAGQTSTLSSWRSSQWKHLGVSFPPYAKQEPTETTVTSEDLRQAEGEDAVPNLKPLLKERTYRRNRGVPKRTYGQREVIQTPKRCLRILSYQHQWVQSYRRQHIKPPQTLNKHDVNM